MTVYSPFCTERALSFIPVLLHNRFYTCTFAMNEKDV